MLGVVVTFRGHAAAMMVNDHPFAPGVALRQTQHGSRHGPPHGEQDDQQQQQPGTKEFHSSSLSQHFAGHPGELQFKPRGAASKMLIVPRPVLTCRERQLDPYYRWKVKHYSQSPWARKG